MNASTPARQRRKPPAARTRRRTSERASKARRGNVKHAANSRREAVEAVEPAVKTSRLSRLRERWSRRRAAAQSALQTASDGDQPRAWPRRLASLSLKLGATIAVAWGLLIAGREVYEYATTSARFEVQHLIYEPTAHVGDEQLRELLAIAPGTNILACDLEQLSEQIAAHPWVALATVTRNLPDTLEVEVVEHEPRAIALAGRFYLVNADGQPFKPVERGDRGELPIITGIDRQTLAKAREDAVAELGTALEIISMYQAKQRPRLGELHLDDDGSVTLYTAEAGTALYLGREDFGARLERWDALRAALGDRADRLAVVHLDHESKPDRRDRVVARFAGEHDDLVVLAQANLGDDDDGESDRSTSPAQTAEPAAPRLPARRSGKRRRIPSYE